MNVGVIAGGQMTAGAPAGGASNAYKVTVTVPSGTVGADLTAFPVMVRLSEMPAAFWAHVRSDGGDIRVQATDGTPVPFDVARFDYSEQDGVLFFRADLAAAADNEYEIHYGNPAFALLAFSDPVGRNAVWADYKAVFLLGETNYNRAGGASLRSTGDLDFFDEVATSPDINGHEGVTRDSAHFYVFDDAALRKYDLSWNLVASNTDVGAGVGNPGITGLGGGTYYDGKLYSAATVSGTQHLAVWDASDLSFIEAFDVSAFAPSAADYAYNPEDGLLYTIRFNDGSTIIKVDPTDGSFQGSITLSFAINQAQGIAYWHGAFWVAADNSDETYRVSPDGVVAQNGLFGSRAFSVSWEGLDGYEDRLYQLDDAGTVEVVRTFKPFDIGLGAGGGAEFWSDARLIGDLASVGVLTSTWTAGVTLIPSDNAQRTPMTLAQTGAGSTGNVQVTVDDGNNLGIWDTDNLWLYPSPTVDPGLGVAHRINLIYDGATARHVFYNGGSKATDAGITARGSAIKHLVIGSAREGSFQEGWRGQVAFAYCRAGILSDDWIAAEYANLSAPEAFCVLGSEEEA